MEYDLSGVWQADIGDGKMYQMCLPGTLDENKIGNPDQGNNQWHADVEPENKREAFLDRKVIQTRYTRKYAWEGEACLTKRVDITIPEGKRGFVACERSRDLKLMVDGERIPEFTPGSLASNYVFEVTGKLNGEHELALLVSNRYEGLPYKDIVNSSMATDETQTNWNGVLGFMQVRIEEAVFISSIRVYPFVEEDRKELMMIINISSDRDYSGVLSICSDALARKEEISVEVKPGVTEIKVEHLLLASDVEYWDEDAGRLYRVSAKLSDYEEKQVEFGVRSFGHDRAGRVTLNGRRIFLRGEANCAAFPETGYAPMEVEAWERILKTYHGYGVNCVRFHSYCPPEAAFVAADRMGMLLQPELSHWNPENAFESEESFSYYKRELQTILLQFANHPSFVMLTLGNELQAGEEGHRKMDELLEMAKQMDATRLFANGSNVHYGELGCDEKSDFYTSMRFYDEDLRGTFSDMEGYINHEYPSAAHNYDGAMEKLRKEYSGPVFSFEVGQYEILPDFHELSQFHGVTEPRNLLAIKERAEQKGMLADWERKVEATGEISRLAYREEIEAVLRTKALSGISLLGLQDFPGQGTALVGMLNSHLVPKAYGFAKTERFQSFFRAQLPLVLLPKYTYENTEELCADIEIANYGKCVMQGKILVELEAQGDVVHRVQREYLPEKTIAQGELTYVGKCCFSLRAYAEPVHLQLKVSVEGEDCRNSYGIWVYPNQIPACPPNVHEASVLDAESKRIIREGGIIYFSPDAASEKPAGYIQTQFTTDFWSVGTFEGQEGGMGQLIDEKHPIFKAFPTSFHTDWQWWPMASQRAVVVPENIQAIVTEMDSYATLRHMAQLFECRCGKAKILFSTLNLQNLQQYPEARALQNAIYQYLASDEFAPQQEMNIEELL